MLSPGLCTIVHYFRVFEMSMGDRLRTLRKKRGLSQEALARAAGCSRSFIAKIEAGAREDVSLSLAVALARALNVTLDELAGLPRSEPQQAPTTATSTADDASLWPSDPVLSILVAALRERGIACMPSGLRIEVESSFWKTCCPTHGDDVVIGRLGKTLYIYAACDCSRVEFLRALGFSIRDLISPTRVTVDDLANHVGLSATFLRSLGVRERGGIIEIPYRDMLGRVVSVRYRFALTKRDAPQGHRFGWRSGSRDIPYGLDRLITARRAGYLIIVEGESDCWTLWHAGFPALGLPGLGKEHLLQADMLHRIMRLYVVEERDMAGAMFAWDVTRHLQKICPSAQVSTLRPPSPAKDINELYQHDKPLFFEWLRSNGATPYSERY